MYKIIFLILLSISIGFIASNVQSQIVAKDAKFVIKGAGSKSCGKFMESYQKNDNDLLIYAGWLEGYLSSYNEYNKDTYDIASFQSIRLLLNFVNSYCKQDENLNFYYVVKSLINSIHSERVSDYSDIVLIKYKDKSTYIYDSVLQKAKTILTDKGYINKTPNKEGLSTKEISGFLVYQKQNNIPTTGLPDERTLTHMFFKK